MVVMCCSQKTQYEEVHVKSQHVESATKQEVHRQQKVQRGEFQHEEQQQLMWCPPSV